MIWQLLDARTFSGIEKHVEVMCEGLNAKGVTCQIVLLTPFSPHPFRERLIAKNIPHLVLDGGFKALRKAVKLHKPSLIHTHGYKAGILGRWVGVPVISTFHAGERGAFPVSLYQLIDEKTAFKAKQNFAVSKQVQARVKNSIVLDNFVPVKDECTKSSLPPVIAFVGRLSYEKAPDIFCEIAALMQNQGLTFRIYGDGAMRQELEKKYAHIVDFRGFTEMTEKQWAEIGVLLMPSRAEGLPMAALEAMAEGVPVVASNVGALSDLTNYLFKVGEIDKAILIINSIFLVENPIKIINNVFTLINNKYNSSKELINIISYYSKYT